MTPVSATSNGAATSNSDKLMQAIASLVQCQDTKDIFELVLCASAALESVDRKAERGSISYERKSKSLSGRWIDGKPTSSKNEDGDLCDDECWIERDRIVSCAIKMGHSRDSPMIPHRYRVIGVFDKLYNKWFMTGEKKAWSPLMKDEDKKRYKVRIRMIDDGALWQYDDIPLDGNSYQSKQIYRIVPGNEIVAVHGKYIPHWVV
jgi:hypothetical protein